MTDVEIIKTLDKAIEAINRQKAEIERLTEDNRELEETIRCLNRECQQAEQKNEIDKAENIKEFAARLKEALTGWETEPTDEEIEYVIDEITEEMAGGRDDD
jgi:chromosome segregation ATPase